MLCSENAADKNPSADVLGGCITCLEGIRLRYRLCHQTCLWAEELWNKLQLFFYSGSPVISGDWAQKIVWPENALQLLCEMIDNYPECVSLRMQTSQAATLLLVSPDLKAPPAWLGVLSAPRVTRTEQNQDAPEYSVRSVSFS